MDQALVKEMGFERVERGRKSVGEFPGAVEVGFTNGGRGGHVFVGSGEEFGEVGLDVVFVVEEVLRADEELLELGFGQRTMDGKLTEASALVAFEVGEDEISETRKIGEGGTGEEMAKLGCGEIGF